MVAAKKQEQPYNIPPPNFQIVNVMLNGASPLVVERFAKKAEIMIKMQTPGAKKKVRDVRDYDKEATQAKYLSTEGWEGINAAVFRNAMISACRIVGFKMTHAKLAVFIEQDGYDSDGIPLVRIFGEAETFTAHTRNATGVIDIRSRPMYKEWAIPLRIKYDADLFSEADIINLISRVGLQVGIGGGRPDSKDSAGCGWGTFYATTNKNEIEKIGKLYNIKA